MALCFVERVILVGSITTVGRARIAAANCDGERAARVVSSGATAGAGIWI